MLIYLTLQIRLKKEQEEKELKRKEKAEAHLYTIIKVKALQIVFHCQFVLPLLISFRGNWEHYPTHFFFLVIYIGCT